MTHRDPDMDCQDFIELITEYLEGGLAPDDRVRFEEHLEICSGCQVYIEQIRATLRLSGQVEPEDVSPGALAKLLDAFRDWKK